MDLSYIAGFFDGEGNFRMGRIKMTNGEITHQLQIRIYGCNKELLEKIKEFLGYGYIYTRTFKENRQDIHQFTIGDKKNCKHFLLKIKDLLIEKKPQAEYLINNFDFERGKTNKYFDIEKFVGFIQRKNVGKFRKYKTITK